jgi:PhnB protein
MVLGSMMVGQMTAGPPTAALGARQLLTPQLVVSDGARAVQFYCRALGAKELYRFCTRQGKVAHAELQLGGAQLVIIDEGALESTRSARSYGGCPVLLRLYSDDVELLSRNFLGAGGFVVEPLRDQVHGDRSGRFRDPEGYLWTLAQHMEDVRPEQLEQRMNALGFSLWRPRTEPQRPVKPPLR